MPQPDAQRAIARDRYDAVLLDLDGVITDTASVHAACWKQMFDEYLQKRATQRSEVFHPFDSAADYRLYVDGKPRFDGVRDFLRFCDGHDCRVPPDSDCQLEWPSAGERRTPGAPRSPVVVRPTCLRYFSFSPPPGSLPPEILHFRRCWLGWLRAKLSPAETAQLADGGRRNRFVHSQLADASRGRRGEGPAGFGMAARAGRHHCAHLGSGRPNSTEFYPELARKTADTKLPGPPGIIDRAALGTLHAGLLGWAFAPDFPPLGLLLLISAALNLWRLTRWRGAATVASRCCWFSTSGTRGWCSAPLCLVFQWSIGTCRSPRSACSHSRRDRDHDPCSDDTRNAGAYRSGTRSGYCHDHDLCGRQSGRRAARHRRFLVDAAVGRLGVSMDCRVHGLRAVLLANAAPVRQ